MTISDTATAKAAQKPTKADPVCATIKERYALTREGSSKETYHISLDLNSCSIDYTVGDSLGIFGQNDPLLVQRLLQAMGAIGSEPICDPRSQEMLTVRAFLASRANLTRLTSSFLKLLYDRGQGRANIERIGQLLQKEQKPLLTDYLKMHDPLALFKEYPDVKIPLQELCNQFGPLLPRFYSVASSPKMFKHEVHLTVALSSYNFGGEHRYGVASHFLCHLAEENKTPVPLYVQPAHNFRLPEKSDTPIIMIGPGTGVAPFRAFMQERQALGHAGKSWLFFGERTRQCEYFYEEFWSSLAGEQKLRLDLAFSRDQAEKIYVQHRMAENARDIWAWLQDGAHLYVCGDAERMAKDVEAALVRIAEEQGNLTPEEAKGFVKGLRAQKRYLLDVY